MQGLIKKAFTSEGSTYGTPLAPLSRRGWKKILLTHERERNLLQSANGSANKSWSCLKKRKHIQQPSEEFERQAFAIKMWKMLFKMKTVCVEFKVFIRIWSTWLALMWLKLCRFHSLPSSSQTYFAFVRNQVFSQCISSMQHFSSDTAIIHTSSL